MSSLVVNPAQAWFESPHGRALLDSEQALVEAALRERPAQEWLWLAPDAGENGSTGGQRLSPTGWDRNPRYATPFSIPAESLGTVVLQHVADGAWDPALLAECRRLLAPGGRLWLFALNPLAPYRWNWRGTGLGGTEPVIWRRRLRRVGFVPEAVSQGIGPRWNPRVDDALQSGAGIRAAYLLRAEKRAFGLTPIRSGRRQSPGTVPATA
ncbi:class I SAM-dependent methyltransferase [Pseudoluteimonas lycopersici]|uniref:Class I SAM-dependent methyltransferase n=1 Tax=Pseudoluteimonas lycopersici TaxID=1324796 RepID=A0A516V242_9GAMM|nr:class I SAM-dependent methyltransferase [Lysobacter lycopersici]QDQ72591.1 class I SAM-dependent methyltransferase [Lysobacter lycopersici]